jgi:CRISPR-associated protein Csy3
MSDTVFKKLPGVLSFQRGIVVTDALFYDDIGGELTPVPVLRHGIRGTQNVNKKGDAETSTSGDAGREEVSNIQTTDTAKTAPDASALVVRFSIRFLDLKNALFSCAPSKGDDETLVGELRRSVDSFIERAKCGQGLDEIALRYARNILNGRWLWRNRLIAQKIAISVAVDGKPVGKADALSIPLNTFGEYGDVEKTVSKFIADGLRGCDDAALEVTARMDLGMQGAMEVFCSQNYLDKGKDKDKLRGFARSLYCLGRADVKKTDDIYAIRVMGHAALRDQKVSNALRTFDTWYPEYGIFNRPIPVEPNGASLDAQKFFRKGKTASAFDLAKRLNTLNPEAPEGMFMIAGLIRGGVFSEGEK